MPPEGIAVAVPLLPPKQLTSVCDEVTLTASAGPYIVAVAVDVHELASVTVTVYVPAVSPVAVIVV